MFDRYRTALMNAEGTPAPTSAPTPAVTPPAASPPPAGEEWRNMSADAFKGRLDEAGSAREKQLMKEFGFKTPAELKTALDEGKKLRDAQLTEQQRLQAQVEELSPRAKRALDLEAAVVALLDTEEKAIPADKQALLGLAPPADQPEARLKWIAMAKAQGLFAGAAAAATTTTPAARPPAPATTMAPPGPAAPAAPGSVNHQAVYDGMKAKGQAIAAAAYRAQHRPDIK